MNDYMKRIYEVDLDDESIGLADTYIDQARKLLANSFRREISTIEDDLENTTLYYAMKN